MCENIMKQNIFFQVQPEFRVAFLERHPPSKTTIQKTVKYQLNGMSLSLNKERSGRRATVGTTDNIQAIQGTLDVKKYLKATRNSLGISTSSFCQIIKQDLCWHSCQMII